MVFAIQRYLACPSGPPVVTTARAVLSLPAVTVAAPAAQAAVVYGCVSMLIRLDPWGSDAAKIATRNAMLLVVWDWCKLAH